MSTKASSSSSSGNSETVDIFEETEKIILANKKIKKHKKEKKKKGKKKQKEEEKEESEPSDEEEEVEIITDDVVAPEDDETCLYDIASKKKAKHANDEDDLAQVIENIVVDEKKDYNVVREIPKDERKTFPYMTKFEFTRLLGERTVQLAGGAKPMIKNATNLQPSKIAFLEMQNNIMPLKLRRWLPNNAYETWEISELKKDELIKSLGESDANL